VWLRATAGRVNNAPRGEAAVFADAEVTALTAIYRGLQVEA